MLANVKIEQDKETPLVHRVYKDGKKIERVRAINFDISAGEIPIILIEIAGGMDFDGMADIHFDYSPQTVKEACKIMREELMKHGDIYDGFCASIYSALEDMPNETRIDEVPKIILNRIIGEE